MNLYKRVKKKMLSHGFLHVRKSPRPFKWGVIGTGYMANTLCAEIAATSSSVVSAVASRDASRARMFAKRYSCPVSYGSYESLITGGKVDVIYVATPLEGHFETVKSCLKHGQNVLCEKPITETLRQFEELVQLAQDNGCFLMEAMWSAMLPTMTFARELIKLGELGEIKLVKIDLNKMENKAGSVTNSGNRSVIWDFGVYPISFLISMLGYRDISIRDVEYVGFDDCVEHWSIRLRVSDVNCDINLSNNYCGSSSAAIIGEQASIQWDSPFNRTNQVRVFSNSGAQKRCKKFKYQLEGYEFQIAEVVAAIRSGYPCSHTYDWECTRRALSLMAEITEKDA